MFEILPVLERQVEECARHRRELAVEADPHGMLCGREGLIVGRIRARIVAEHIAGKLVEYDRQRETTWRGVAPAIEFTARRTLIIAEKATADLRIEFQLGREP